VSCSPAELLAVLAARELRGVTTVFAGVGLPLLAAVVAQKTHTPSLTIVVEGGSIGLEMVPGKLPNSTNEMRIAHRARMLPGITDTFLFAQRGFLDVGFVGGAQIDRHGNLNSSVVGPYERPAVRLPGSGGANDILSLCRRVMAMTVHERRRFVPRVDFVTSPGYLHGGDARQRAGLIFGQLSRVVTNLCILGFDDDARHASGGAPSGRHRGRRRAEHGFRTGDPGAARRHRAAKGRGARSTTVARPRAPAPVAGVRDMKSVERTRFAVEGCHYGHDVLPSRKSREQPSQISGTWAPRYGVA